jgi:hypothetical protein
MRSLNLLISRLLLDRSSTLKEILGMCELRSELTELTTHVDAIADRFPKQNN